MGAARLGKRRHGENGCLAALRLTLDSPHSKYRMDAPDRREPTGIAFGTSGRLRRVLFTDAVKHVQDEMDGIQGLLVVRFDFFILNSTGNS